MTNRYYVGLDIEDAHHWDRPDNWNTHPEGTGDPGLPVAGDRCWLPDQRDGGEYAWSAGPASPITVDWLCMERQSGDAAVMGDVSKLSITGHLAMENMGDVNLSAFAAIGLTAHVKNSLGGTVALTNTGNKSICGLTFEAAAGEITLALGAGGLSYSTNQIVHNSGFAVTITGGRLAGRLYDTGANTSTLTLSGVNLDGVRGVSLANGLTLIWADGSGFVAQSSGGAPWVI